jgi:hypothetical protein
MVNASTPWTVRTTKRKLPTSAPNPRKRHRSLEDVEGVPTSVQRKPRQQTLTQIQFVPHRSQDNEDDDLKPISTVPRRGQARPNVDRLQKRNSTLTQMDFLAPPTINDDQEDELTPFQDNGNIENGDGALTQLDGSRDAPDPSRQGDISFTGKSTVKRKGTPLFSQGSQESRPTKKRKNDDKVAADTPELGRRTSNRVASTKATRSIGFLSTRYGGDHDENLKSRESPSIRRKAAAPRAQDVPALLQEPLWPSSEQETQPSLQREAPSASFPRTPSKRKNVVPSSQSPESLPPSTRGTNSHGAFSHVLPQERSPLKERSVNALLSLRGKIGKESSPIRLQGPSPPKRKICILKLPRHNLQQERATVENKKTVSKQAIWSAQSSIPRAGEPREIPVMPVLEAKESTEDSEPRRHVEQPLQALALEVNDSEEDELEEPRTSQVGGQRPPASSPRATETQETLPSLRGLLALREVHEEATHLQKTDELNQPGHSHVIVKDFAMGDNQWRAPHSQKAAVEEDEPPCVKPAVAASVADSEEECSVLALSPGFSIANDTQFNADLAERLPTSSADASPLPSPTAIQGASFSPSSQLEREIELSLPRPNPVHRPGTYSTTKTVPLNDTSSSPSLPSRSTQRTVYPASLPRPSQVSTQDPTQPYLPLSSMPLAPFSSPTRSEPATITIKDSSSVSRPLRYILSQRHSPSPPQLHPNVDLGLDDCLDAEIDDELEEELMAMSDKTECVVDEEEDSQGVPLLPLQRSQTRAKSQIPPKTTEQGSPVKSRRPRKPVIPPEVREVLGESFLESVPGPPGWSQRSWDDEPL